MDFLTLKQNSAKVIQNEQKLISFISEGASLLCILFIFSLSLLEPEIYHFYCCHHISSNLREAFFEKHKLQNTKEIIIDSHITHNYAENTIC